MNPTLALLLVIGIIVVICWLASPVWRRCRCGAQYCNSCSRRR